MSALAQTKTLSFEEYLATEERSPVKREYLAGQVYAMAGTTVVHNSICVNIAAGLHRQLRGSSCRVFVGDVKVLVRAVETFYYPDVFVACAPDDREPLYKEKPSLIVEVLSPSTETIDRREKMSIYKRLESLEEYVLVAQDLREIEIHRRLPGGFWSRALFHEGNLVLESLGVELELDEIYAGVDFV